MLPSWLLGGTVDKKKILWARRLWGKSKKRARESGIEFTLTPQDIFAVFPDKCPILLIELAFVKGINDCLPSLDRVDNTRGYVPGNVRVISWKCNYVKKDLTLEQIERLYLYSKGQL